MHEFAPVWHLTDSVDFHIEKRTVATPWPTTAGTFRSRRRLTRLTRRCRTSDQDELIASRLWTINRLSMVNNCYWYFNTHLNHNYCCGKTLTRRVSGENRRPLSQSSQLGGHSAFSDAEPPLSSWASWCQVGSLTASQLQLFILIAPWRLSFHDVYRSMRLCQAPMRSCIYRAKYLVYHHLSCWMLDILFYDW